MASFGKVHVLCKYMLAFDFRPKLILTFGYDQVMIYFNFQNATLVLRLGLLPVSWH